MLLQTAKIYASWKSLGYDLEGSTQALIFDATIKEERNPYMIFNIKTDMLITIQ